MSDLNKDTIAYLTQLSRIACSEEEQEKLLKDMQSILAYADLLQEADTSGVEPCNHVLEGMNNVMREDIPEDILPRDTFLANAPAHVGGMIKVPPVIKPN